ncbi:YoaK family protein [Neobacillus cucumis]|uniref:YoaK family protein n=1 Tax=Neobacillus cucumis TaxID=1740721 RepID=UPI002853347E|nr:YoaK family protein [Neobacillus cucumis]MDR4948046.1 YoaK family protein [Neobacillus cucumis]
MFLKIPNFRRYIDKSRSFLPKITAESVSLGILLALVGGFLDAYTYVSRDGVFATSQTGNLVLLGVEVAHGQWEQGLHHIPPIVAFVLGVAVAEGLKHPHITRTFPYPARTVLLLESIVLVIVGTWPPQVPNTIVTITIAFVASVQISSFRTLVKWPYNSAMVTGNLRTAAQAAYTALVLRDRKGLLQFIDFSLIIISFLLGALFGTLSTLQWGAKAIWLASGIQICAMLVLNSNPKTLLKRS